MANSKFLITGSSGTGKSTLCRELKDRGINAFDADDRVLGLCSWVNKATGEALGRGFPADFSVEKYDWNWNEKTLQKLLADHETIYLCGNANNSTDFYELFDHVFVLSVDEQEQRRRMNIRTEHDFGKDIATQNAVVKRQKQLLVYAESRDAIMIEASGPPATIAERILQTSSWKLA